VAWNLSWIEGFPKFKPDWPEADKDIAAAGMADFLAAHGSQIRAFPAKLQDTGCFVERVYLVP
jgi:hypothetical protein